MKPFHKSIIGSGNFGRKEEQKVDGVVVVPGPSWVGTISEAGRIGSDQFDVLKGLAVSGVLSGATFRMGVDLAAPEGDSTAIRILKSGDNEAQFYGGTPGGRKLPETKPEAKTTIKSLNIEAIYNEYEQRLTLKATGRTQKGELHCVVKGCCSMEQLKDGGIDNEFFAVVMNADFAKQGINPGIESEDIRRAIERRLAPKTKEKTAFERLRDAVMDAKEGDEYDLDLAIYINPRFRDALRKDQPFYTDSGFDAFHGVPIYCVEDDRHPDFIVVPVP